MKNFTIELDSYMSNCMVKGLSPKTMASYEQSLGLFFHYMVNEQKVHKVEKVTTDHIREYMNYLEERGKYTVVSNERTLLQNFPENRTDYQKKISRTTQANYLRNIKAFFSYAHNEGIVAVNPAKGVPHIKPTRTEKKLLTKSELDMVFKAMDRTTFHGYRNYIISKLILDSGMRISECLALIDTDIDFRYRSITLTKDVKFNKERMVYVSQTMMEDLKRWIRYRDRYSSSELLFPTIRGTQLSIKNFEGYLSGIGKRFGLEVTPHVLRNNFAKYFLMSGGNIATLSRLLGHSSVEVTQRAYLDFTDKELSRMYKSPLENLNL